MTTAPIQLSTSMRFLRRSKAAVICAVFVIVLAPIAVGLWVSSLDAGEGVGTRTLYWVALAAPVAGMLIALLSLVSVMWRRTRPVLVVDDQVRLPRSGVRFDLDQLSRVELYSRRGPHLVLLPSHVDDGVSVRTAPKAVADYTVAFPPGATWQPVELVDELRRRVPGVVVEKHGTI